MGLPWSSALGKVGSKWDPLSNHCAGNLSGDGTRRETLDEKKRKLTGKHTKTEVETKLYLIKQVVGRRM